MAFLRRRVARSNPSAIADLTLVLVCVLIVAGLQCKGTERQPEKQRRSATLSTIGEASSINGHVSHVPGSILVVPEEGIPGDTTGISPLREGTFIIPGNGMQINPIFQSDPVKQ
jgi:hypothetical protein